MTQISVQKIFESIRTYKNVKHLIDVDFKDDVEINLNKTSVEVVKAMIPTIIKELNNNRTHDDDVLLFLSSLIARIEHLARFKKSFYDKDCHLSKERFYIETTDRKHYELILTAENPDKEWVEIPSCPNCGSINVDFYICYNCNTPILD